MISVDPQEIEQKQFKTTRLKEGYDPDEVDAFLDDVAAEVKALHRELAKSEDARNSLRRQLENVHRNSEASTMNLPLAVESTSANAVRILEAAQKTADAAVASAEEEGQKIVADARKDADAARYAALAECNKAEARLEELRGKHADLRAFLKQHLENGLAELEGNAP